MVKSQGVEAYLVRHMDNYRYPEHRPPPTSRTAPDTSAMAYVEVATHDRYEIAIVLTADFDFKGARDVKITWETDNRRLYTTYTAAAVRDAIDRTGQDETRVRSRPSFLCGYWVDCGLFFADLQIDADAKPTSDQVSYDLEAIGQVKIKVECGVVGATDFHAPMPLVMSASSSEDVVRKNHVSHTTGYTPIGSCQPQSFIKLFNPTEAAGYQPVTLALRFRSRTSLQLLKIIPDDGDDNTRDAAHRSTSLVSSTPTVANFLKKVPDKKEKRKLASFGSPKQSRNEMHVLNNVDVSRPTVALRNKRNSNTLADLATQNLPVRIVDAAREQPAQAEATPDRNQSAPAAQTPSLDIRASAPLANNQPC